MNFADRLDELLIEKSKKATEVCRELGLGNSTISHYRVETRMPKVSVLIRLADYFNCTVDFLLGIDDYNKATSFKVCPPFSQRILELCDEFKTTRYKLQKLTGISESVMRYWVRGKTEPSIYNIVRIADKLKCSVDFVLGREK